MLNLSPIKVIACIRRKPGLTQKEYLDYHWQVHGAISDAPENLDEKPCKYTQIHYFDAAFSAPISSKIPNQNHVWVGRDDSTELWFRDASHASKCFSSDWVRNKVGPDGINFNDFATAFSILTVEKNISIPTSIHLDTPVDEATVAHLWLAQRSGSQDGSRLEQRVSPILVAAIEKFAGDDVYDLRADVGTVCKDFDIGSYFGRAPDVPAYTLVYKIYLANGSASIPAVRKAQKAFEEAAASLADVEEEWIHQESTFIAFGKVGLILDVHKNVKFDRSRQPVLY